MTEIVEDSRQALRLRWSESLHDRFDAMNVFVERRGPAGAQHNRIVTIPKNIEVEEYTSFLGDRLYQCGAFSYAEAGLLNASVGRYCSIATGFHTFGERHPIERVTSSSITYCFSETYNKPQFLRAHKNLLGGVHTPDKPADMRDAVPVIEHDVWIGQHVQMARGIKVGTGAVVAAGAIVTKDIAPYMIVGGNPAKIIRARFPPALAQSLLESRWWEYHPKLLWTFGYDDPQAFCEKLFEARDKGTLKKLEIRRYTWRDFLG